MLKSNVFHKNYPEQMFTKQIFIVLARWLLKFYANKVPDHVQSVIGDEENGEMEYAKQTKTVNGSELKIKEDVFDAE